jgi:hypothetical protein
MSKASRHDVIAIAGALDEVVISNILAMGTTTEELAEAQAWVANEEALLNAGKRYPAGRAKRVLDLIAKVQEEEEEAETR